MCSITHTNTLETAIVNLQMLMQVFQLFFFSCVCAFCHAAFIERVQIKCVQYRERVHFKETHTHFVVFDAHFDLAPFNVCESVIAFAKLQIVLKDDVKRCEKNPMTFCRL